MKKLTSTVFAALIGLTLSMPAFSQATSTTPAQNTSKKTDNSKDSKDTKGKKAKKKGTKKTDTDNKKTTPAQK